MPLPTSPSRRNRNELAIESVELWLLPGCCLVTKRPLKSFKPFKSFNGFNDRTGRMPVLLPTFNHFNVQRSFPFNDLNDLNVCHFSRSSTSTG